MQRAKGEAGKIRRSNLFLARNLAEASYEIQSSSHFASEIWEERGRGESMQPP